MKRELKKKLHERVFETFHELCEGHHATARMNMKRGNGVYMCSTNGNAFPLIVNWMIETSKLDAEAIGATENDLPEIIGFYSKLITGMAIKMAADWRKDN